MENASERHECRKLTAELISSGVTRDKTPRVKCKEPVGRMIVGGMVSGRRALKAVTLLRKAGERRGRHMKCVFAGAFGFIKEVDASKIADHRVYVRFLDSLLRCDLLRWLERRIHGYLNNMVGMVLDYNQLSSMDFRVTDFIQYGTSTIKPLPPFLVDSQHPLIPVLHDIHASFPGINLFPSSCALPTHSASYLSSHRLPDKRPVAIDAATYH